MVPIALALLAIVMGGAGLYFGMTANQQLAPLTESIDEGSSSTAQLEKQIESLGNQISELSAKNDSLTGSLQRLGRESSQTLRTATQAETGVASNRQELVNLAEAIQQIANAGSSRAQQASTSTNSSESSGSASSEGPTLSGSSAGTYNIQSGDTFGKIANIKGVSLDALMDANPDADPRRLRIGQEINIPVN